MSVLTTLWLGPLIAVLIVWAVLVSIARIARNAPAGFARRRYWRSVLIVDGCVTVVRIGICWWAAYRAFVHRESLSELPFLVLLMPEYLLAPGDPATPAGMWSLTVALVFGSFVSVSALALLVWRFFGRAGAEGVA